MPEPVNKIIPAQDPVSLTGALSEGSEIAIGPDIAITDEEDSIGSSTSHNNEIVDDANISSDSCTESLSDEEISNDDSSEPVDSDKEMNNDSSSEPDDPYSQLKNLFDPIYKDASVTLCGAFCAIMEFKRSCRLPFTAIEKLLCLLQLFCPPDNTLPKTLNEIKKFFGAASSIRNSHKYFCATCDVELQAKEKNCDLDTCLKKEPSTLVVLDAAMSLKRVLRSKLELVL